MRLGGHLIFTIRYVTVRWVETNKFAYKIISMLVALIHIRNYFH